MDNIYLLGFMGTGKSSAGEVLAQRLKLDFIDLDALIEDKEKETIVDIFKKKGEEYFRKLETQTLGEVAKRGGLVVACGGGIVLKEENIKIMEKSGIPICLEASAEVIYARTRDETFRPLLNVPDPLARIKELLRQRKPFYDKIKLRLDTTGLTIEETAIKIEGIIKKDGEV